MVRSGERRLNGGSTVPIGLSDSVWYTYTSTVLGSVSRFHRPVPVSCYLLDCSFFNFILFHALHWKNYVDVINSLF